MEDGKDLPLSEGGEGDCEMLQENHGYSFENNRTPMNIVLRAFCAHVHFVLSRSLYSLKSFTHNF